MAGDVISVRFARCPKCRRVHTERSNVSVYSCSGCGAILRARHSPAKKEEEEEEEEEENPPQSQQSSDTNNPTTNSLPPTNKSPPSISISISSSSEAKSSAPPVQSPPPAAAAADAFSNSGSLSSSSSPPAKLDKPNPLSRRTFKSSMKTTPESSSTNSGKFPFVDDLSFASLSSDTTTKLENLRMEDRQSSSWRPSAREGSLEDEAGSSWSGGSRQRGAPALPKRRHCRAVAGAAPLVLCSGCEELLQLPADFLLLPGRRRLRCGSCSMVLAFWFAAGGRLRPARGAHR